MITEKQRNTHTHTTRRRRRDGRRQKTIILQSSNLIIVSDECLKQKVGIEVPDTQRVVG